LKNDDADLLRLRVIKGPWKLDDSKLLVSTLTTFLGPIQNEELILKITKTFDKNKFVFFSNCKQPNNTLNVTK